MIEKAREAGPVLVLEAGDALFPRADGKPAEGDVARAELLLEATGAFGTAAMNVGERDLVLGHAWLLERARKAKLPLLSANLVLAGGERPFEARRLLEVGPAKVGVIGLWLPTPGVAPPAGFSVSDPVAAATEHVAALRAEGADAVVILAHGTPLSAQPVAALEGVDLVIPAHQGFGGTAPRTRADAGWILGTGHQGRSVLRIDLSLGNPGPLVDATGADRARREFAAVHSTVSRLEQAMATVSPADRASRQSALDEARARLDALKEEASRVHDPAGRSFHAKPVHLGEGSPESPVWAERLRQHEAKYPRPH